MNSAMSRGQWRTFLQMAVSIRQDMGKSVGIADLKRIEQILTENIEASKFNSDLIRRSQMIFMTEAIREIRWELLQQVQAERENHSSDTDNS